MIFKAHFDASLNGLNGVIKLLSQLKCKNNLWYSDKLVEYEHYVPVKHDLSDLIEKIEWCRNNDNKCKIISENAKKFYNTYFYLIYTYGFAM